jgi:tetratricopeptide (TPR) repeat protein
MLLSQVIKDHKQAFASFDRVTKLKDDFYPAWLSKGLALIELKDYQKAVDTFDKAIAINPKDPLAWSNRGFALQQLGKKAEAQKSYSHGDRLTGKSK